MGIRKRTIGVDFPFKDSSEGDYLKLTKTPEVEIKANLVHLLTTQVGQRYYKPSFGVNLRKYLFEQLDEGTKERIREEITSSVETWLPNIKITRINIKGYDKDENEDDYNLHKITISIDYTITNRVFEYTDNLTLNIE
jgi:phage baseplate assembly protein W